MMQNRPACQDGWEPAEVLAYVEGEMSEAVSRDFARHLKNCPACSAEVESFRELDRLLKSHPESFHPAADKLYGFVSTGSDPEGRISEHVASCPECRADVELVRHMLEVGPETPGMRRPMPAPLVEKLEALYGAPTRSEQTKTVMSWLAEKVGISPFRLPVLALGTGAAALIVAVLVIPLFTASLKTLQQADIPPEEKPIPHAGSLMPLPKDHQAELNASREREQAKDQPAAEAPKLEKRTAPAPEERKLATEPKPALKGITGRGEQFRKNARRQDSPASLEGPSQQLPAAPPSKSKVRSRAKQSDAAVPATPGVLSPTRIPIAVKILDSEGAAVPWVKFIVPQGLSEAYEFSEAPDRGPDEVTGKMSPGRAPARETAQKGLVIRFRLAVAGENFNIQGELLERGASQPNTSLTVTNVSREDLPNQVSLMTAKLLLDGLPGEEFSKRKE
jgi:hypothetical protein